MSTTKVVFDGRTGVFWATDPAYVIDPNGVVADVPSDVATWRLSYDVEAQAVVIKFDGMTDAEAEVANVEAEKADAAARVAAKEAARAAAE